MSKLGRPPYELTFNYTEDGCKVPVRYKLNQDGYFRKRVDGDLVMYHRYCYEQEVSLIPKGMEVDHICKNRACCNVEHLQLLPSSEHRSKDNTGRYEHKISEAKELVRNNPNQPMSWVAEKIGVSFSSTCRWKRNGLLD